MKDSEHKRNLVLWELVKYLCNIRRFFLAEKISELSVFLVIEKLTHFCDHSEHTFTCFLLDFLELEIKGDRPLLRMF